MLIPCDYNSQRVKDKKLFDSKGRKVEKNVSKRVRAYGIEISLGQQDDRYRLQKSAVGQSKPAGARNKKETEGNVTSREFRKGIPPPFL